MVYPLLKNKVVETQGLIAIMAQWGLTADQLLPTIDKINVTADNYAVSSEDLVAGLTRSSGAAKVLGLTLDETIGILTVMREATGRTGKEVGNALNSILSFMQRPTAIKAFETQGIRVFADTARTEFRNVIQIFDEMASKWPSMSPEAQDIFSEQAEQAGLYSEEMAEAIGLQQQWTDIQQRDLSQAAAGIYRRNYLLALLQNWSKVDKVLIGLEDSLGYSMKENERTMATLEKRIEALKAAAEQFAVAIGDAGLLDEMKKMVDGVSDVMQWFNGLDDTMKALIITFAEMTLAVKLTTAMMNMMGLSGAGMAGGLLRGWAVPITATTAKVRVLTGAVTGLAAVLKNLGAGAMALFGGPLAFAVTVALTAAFTLYRHIKKTREELEALPVTVQNMQAQVEAIKGLEKEYDVLSAKVSKTEEEKKKLADITAKLGEMFPDAIAAIDEEGRAREINNGILQESINLKKEDLELTQQEMAKQFANFDESGTGKKAIGLLKDIRELEGYMESLTRQANRMGLDASGYDFSEQRKEIIELKKELQKLEPAFYQQALAALNANDKFRDLSETIKNQLVASVRNSSKDVVEANERINALISQGDLPLYIDAMDKSFKRFGESAKDASDLEELNKSFGTFLDGVMVAGKEMGYTNEESIQMAYAIMKIQDPTATAQLKLSQLDGIIKQVGVDSSKMASAASNASNILATNVSNATMRTIAAHWEDIKAVKDRAKAYEILAKAIKSEAYVGESLGLSMGMMGSTYQARVKEAGEWVEAYYELEALVRGGGSGSGDLPPPPFGDGSGGSGGGKEIDYLAEALKKLTDAAKQFEITNMGLESALDAVNRVLGVSNAELDYLNSKLESGTATARDYARMQELIAQKMIYLRREQSQLTNANAVYQTQIDALSPTLAKATAEHERFKAAGDEEHTKDAASAVSALTKEIDSLSGSIADNTQKIWENKATLEELTRATYTQYYQSAMDWMGHMSTMGKMTTQQQIDYLLTIEQVNLALADQRGIQEKIFSSLKEEMGTYLEDLDTARDNSLSAIETRVKATIAALQAQIDALDNEEKADSREESERKHNEKIAQLQKDRQYHELRTGTEHAKAIADIDEQIAEENRNWQQQQEDWIRDDKKEALKKQIQDTKDAGEKEKDAIKENYKKAKKIIDQNMNTIVNGLMARKDEWQSTGKTLIDAFVEGIKSGDFAAIEKLMDDLNTLSKKTKKKSSPSDDDPDDSPPPNPKETLSAWFANETKYLQKLKQTGDAGQKEWANQGLYLINLARNGDAGQKIWARQEAEKIGIVIPQAHIGAKVKSTGIAELMHDERVLSPQLTVSFEKLAAALSRPAAQSQIDSLGSNTELVRKVDKLIAVMERKGAPQVNGPAVNIEHAEFENKYDGQSLGIDVRNVLSAIG